MPNEEIKPGGVEPKKEIDSNILQVSPIDGRTSLIRQAESLDAFLRMIDSPQLAGDLGEHFSCEEVETFVELLRAYGLDAAADDMFDRHCCSDEDGDDPDHLARAKELGVEPEVEAEQE